VLLRVEVSPEVRLELDGSEVVGFRAGQSLDRERFQCSSPLLAAPVWAAPRKRQHGLRTGEHEIGLAEAGALHRRPSATDDHGWRRGGVGGTESMCPCSSHGRCRRRAAERQTTSLSGACLFRRTGRPDEFPAGGDRNDTGGKNEAITLGFTG
jgi:hypothetical protein